MPEVRLYHHPHHAHLGDHVMQITDPSPGLRMVLAGYDEADPAARVPHGTLPSLPARRDHDDLVDRLDTIISELEGLRADLRSRTLAARLARLWAWIRRFW